MYYYMPISWDFSYKFPLFYLSSISFFCKWGVKSRSSIWALSGIFKVLTCTEVAVDHVDGRSGDFFFFSNNIDFHNFDDICVGSYCWTNPYQQIWRVLALDGLHEVQRCRPWKIKECQYLREIKNKYSYKYIPPGNVAPKFVFHDIREQYSQGHVFTIQISEAASRQIAKSLHKSAGTIMTIACSFCRVCPNVLSERKQHMCATVKERDELNERALVNWTLTLYTEPTAFDCTLSVYLNTPSQRHWKSKLFSHEALNCCHCYCWQIIIYLSAYRLTYFWLTQ